MWNILVYFELLASFLVERPNRQRNTSLIPPNMHNAPESDGQERSRNRVAFAGCESKKQETPVKQPGMYVR